MTSHQAWFDRISGDDSKVQAARKAGIPASTLTHQLRKGRLGGETVISLARGYGVSPVAALAETGHLTAAEAADVPPVDSARLLTDRQLILEFMRRINIDPSSWDVPLTEEGLAARCNAPGADTPPGGDPAADPAAAGSPTPATPSAPAPRPTPPPRPAAPPDADSPRAADPTRTFSWVPEPS